jgi:hypothetical protein
MPTTTVPVMDAQIPGTFISTTIAPWMTISAVTEKPIAQNATVETVNNLNNYISKKQAAESKISLVSDDSKKTLVEMRKDDSANFAIENNNILMLGTFTIASLLICTIIAF